MDSPMNPAGSRLALLPDMPSSLGYASYLEFTKAGLQPPGAAYLERDDNLLLQVVSPTITSTVRVTLRVLLPSGQINTWVESRAVLTATQAFNLLPLTALECFLLSVSISSDAPNRGACFVRLLIQRGTGSSDVALGQVLCQGYASLYETLTFPNGLPESSLAGSGLMRLVTVAAPGAGADFVVTVPAGRHWKLLGVEASLAASAAVASRSPNGVIDDGAANPFRIPGNILITATQTIFVNFLQGGAGASSSGLADIIPLPFGLRMLPGWRFSSITTNLQAGDQWSAVQLIVEEFCAPL